ncbi:hypothetical protein ANAEL_01550 [Anaerolineales bacterium]|nr:hypothetical protein ANAEL_01550 [Anaerolineales bacterium]
MNKKIFWILLPLITLTACSFNFGTVGSTAGGVPTGGGAATELPTQTKLILGIINLEETENAVTAEQAKELVPMFYVLQGLNESDTAAQEEIDGLTNQIQETLTDTQVQAIDGMSLSMRDMFSIVQGNSGNTTASGTTSTSSGGGGMGGPPDMGGGLGGEFPGGMPGGGGMTTSSSSDQSSRPATTGTPTVLFDTAIKLLEKKLQ